VVIGSLATFFWTRHRKATILTPNRNSGRHSAVERRDYTLQELQALKANGGSLLVAVRGDVYDVSGSSSMFGPEQPFHVYVGADCSRALAKMSFDPADLNKSLDGLAAAELSNLEDWVQSFAQKYECVGRLL